MKFLRKSNKIINIEMIFSFFLILILFLIISIIFTNIYINSLKIQKNAEATAIMTNILENMRKKIFKDFESYIDELSTLGISKQIENETLLIFVNGEELQEKFFGTDISKDYNLVVKISNTDKKFDLAKNVDITISYIIFGKSYSLQINTLIEREIIKEVNEPIINKEYFSPLNINIDNYDIIPIKYSKELKSYIITDTADPDWYNYSSKEWAKVLLFEKNGNVHKDQFIDVNGIVSKQANYNNNVLNLYNYMYVWIPNFSIKDNETFFRYGSGKNEIKMDYLYEDGKYLYFYSVSDEIEDISTECSFDGINGVWKNVNNYEDEYYKYFTKTKYGPINLH